MDEEDYPLEGDGGITADADNELLEGLEERRLRRLGIDPDLPQWTIYMELKKRMKKIQEEEEAREKKSQGEAGAKG
jgi:hypothetical protein